MRVQKLMPSLVVVLATLVILTGCGVTEPEEKVSSFATETNELIFQIDIQSSDTIASVEKQYSGEVVAWLPDEGTAILSGNASAELAQQNVVAEQNIDVVSSVVMGSAFGSVFGSAFGSAFGSSVFGSTAFGSAFGSAVFGSGVNDAYLLNNETTWNQVELYDAHLSATNLGNGIKVAVIDSGVDYQHHLLKDNFSPSSEWMDYVDSDFIPFDESGGVLSGHGTAVTGIVLQVAPKVKVLPIRVLDTDGYGDLDDVVSAIIYAVNQNVDVINLSLGEYNHSSVLQTAISYAVNKGVYIAAAAGNQSSNSINYPAKMSSWGMFKSHLFAVASVDRSYNQSTFTNWGGEIVASAPGEAVQTTYPGDMLVNVTGTSFSTPIVAGGIALLIAENPSANVLTQLDGSLQFPKWQIAGTLSIEQLINGLY